MCEKISKSKRGFTLTEIIITVIIVGVLASVAIPRFTGSIERVKAAEGVHLLTALLGAQKAFKFENGGYAANLAVLDIDFPTPPSNFASPTAANNANAVASITRTGGYTLSINENGTISCSNNGGITCGRAGY